MKKGIRNSLISGSVVCSFLFAYGCAVNNSQDKKNEEKPVTATRAKVYAVKNRCDSADYCEEPDCQRYALGVHLITKDIFDSCQQAYAKAYPSAKQSTPYFVRTLKAKLNGLNCTERDYIGFARYDDDEDIQLTANDIIEIAEFDSIRQPVFHGRYSIQFFRGLIDSAQLKDADTIYFYKVLVPDPALGSKPSVGMKVSNNANGSYLYADLSELYP